MKKLAFVLGLTMTAGLAHAQYPNKPIRVIVPYAAGGAADITARVVTQKMSEQMLEVTPGEMHGRVGFHVLSHKVHADMAIEQQPRRLLKSYTECLAGARQGPSL